MDFGGLSFIGGGIQDLFAAGGMKKDAASLDAAAGMEDVNAKIAQASMEIQHSAAQRDIFKVSGAQQADIATAGFKMSGSALDLQRDTARQGALTQSLIQAQGEIEVQGHEIAAANDRAQAASDRRAAQGSMLGGIMNIGVGLLGLFSDERMKENLERVGTNEAGLPIYAYNYKADPNKTRYVGFLAQDVERVEPDQVIDLGLKFIGSKYAPQVANA